MAISSCAVVTDPIIRLDLCFYFPCHLQKIVYQQFLLRLGSRFAVIAPNNSLHYVVFDGRRCHGTIRLGPGQATVVTFYIKFDITFPYLKKDIAVPLRHENYKPPNSVYVISNNHDEHIFRLCFVLKTMTCRKKWILFDDSEFQNILDLFGQIRSD